MNRPDSAEAAMLPPPVPKRSTRTTARLTQLPDTEPVRVALEQIDYWRSIGLRVPEMLAAMGMGTTRGEYDLVVRIADAWARMRRAEKAGRVTRLAAAPVKPGGRPVMDPDEDAEAARLYREGYDTVDLSRRYGLHRNAILRALRRAGVTIRPPGTRSARRAAETMREAA